jgi:hypothetical protein
MNQTANAVLLVILWVPALLAVLGMTYVPLSLVLEDIKKRRKAK